MKDNFQKINNLKSFSESTQVSKICSWKNETQEWNCVCKTGYEKGVKVLHYIRSIDHVNDCVFLLLLKLTRIEPFLGFYK